MQERKIGQKTNFTSAFNEPLIHFESSNKLVFAVSVKAETNQEVLVKVRNSLSQFE